MLSQIDGQKKTRNLQVKVTPNQFERIKNNAQAKGFVTVAQFLRYLALDKDMQFEKKFNELYDKIIDKEITLNALKKKIGNKKDDYLI